MKKQKNVASSDLRTLKVLEKELTKLEKERSKIETRLLKDATGAPGSVVARHARRNLGAYALLRFRRRQLLYFMVTTIGVLMVWVGAWHLIERFIPNPWMSLCGGLAIIWATKHYH